MSKSYGIEYLRLIGFFAVVVIHANALDLFGDWRVTGYVSDQLSRFAVPGFFIISGYLWKREEIAKPHAASWKLVSKIVPIFVAWIAIYMIAEFSGLYPREFGVKIAAYLAVPFTGGPGFHLWFLSALVLGSALCWIAIDRFGERTALISACCLYASGVLIGTYGHLWGLRFPLFTYRNGIIEAPVLLMIGYLLQGSRFLHANRLFFATMALGGIVVQISEGILSGRFPATVEYSFGTVPFSVGLFGLFLSVNISDRGWGKAVLGAYLIHLFVLKVLAAHLVSTGPLPAFTVTIAAALMSLVIARLLLQSPARKLVSA